MDWTGLVHAYGSAVDVPGQIRALRSSEAGQRADALGQLYGNIFHQGSRYGATAYAVPFLLEVLAAPDTADPAGLLKRAGFRAAAGPARGWPQPVSSRR